ncbi:hypothetical protein MSAN_02067400 [Mycena sanguinolenta]|uniref:Kelch repeat protein n=1 Tax=Mycena sanguinolenta TaxID=230812 RepID=A0A8H6XJX4_9AGAR|nr:hypothetical protein MSAN_02067400 [Mycena sanguinolenta]
MSFQQLTTTERTLVQLMANVSLTCRQGDKLFEEGKFEAAEKHYLEIATSIVGSSFRLPMPAGDPSGGVVCDLYLGLDLWKITNLMGCCVGMAKCLRRKNELEMALAWCDEVNALYRCGFYQLPQPVYDWHDWTPALPELILVKSTALCIASEILATLCNSGTATTRRWNAYKTTKNLPMNHQTTALHSVLDANLRNKMLGLRHPDPQAPQTTGRVSGLQVRGSWSRLNVAKLGGVTDGREAFASFIWNMPMDLSTETCGNLISKALTSGTGSPNYPTPLRASGRFIGWTMIVRNDTTLLFTGRPTLDVFNLTTETWTTLNTTYSATSADVDAGIVDGWPWPGKVLFNCTVVFSKTLDKLYVFGGQHGRSKMGCNLFMELDLTTRVWRRLSGFVRAPQVADYSCPSPRKNAAGWASPNGRRIYLLFGHFDREAPSQGEFHSAGEAFGHEDFWSWNIEEERWRRERISGNPPCSRTEFATRNCNARSSSVATIRLCPHTSSSGVKSSNLTIPTSPTPSSTTSPPPAGNRPEPTFAAPKWQQVLTPGFPTYRCQAQLAVDSDTGKTYMFGGWTNNQYIPTHTQMISRSFGDVWELRVDLPGGNFEEVDEEEEIRIAKAGPWQRCFACASAGPWKKCGGGLRRRNVEAR